MGVTFDIGEDVLRAIDNTFGDIDPDWTSWQFDWCWPHDNNMVFGFCSCCEDSQNPAPWSIENIMRIGHGIWRADNPNRPIPHTFGVVECDESGYWDGQW